MKFSGEVAARSLHGVMSAGLGEMVDAIAAMDRVIAQAEATRALMIDQARAWSEATEGVSERPGDRGWSPSVRARRVLAAELACALRIPERTAENLVADSRMLVHELPATLEALTEGRVSWRHAVALADQARTLPEEARAVFEDAVLPHAERLTVALFRRRARRVRELAHPESVDARHQRAAGDRRVELQHCADGMSWLSLFLPAATAQAAYNRVIDIGDHERRAPGPDDELTVTQRRADVAAGLLIEGTLLSGRDAGIRATVAITVPVLRLLGLSGEPATLEGYGPIDGGTAVELAGTARSFIRILTHPETGTVLSVGRDRYRPPADLAMFLRIADETCRFPGCARAARNSDIDHTIDWIHHGQTAHDNLAHLCPAHHHLKHQTAWKARQLPGRVLEWTSPGGHRYHTEPAMQLHPIA